jgi:LynF/TruF/PatF family peptide O-prenyltransferase
VTLSPVFQDNCLRDRRLRFMRNHQAAFDVDPVFPLPLYEDVVLQMQGSCGVESSCEVKGNQLFAGCFDVSSYKDANWPKSLIHTFNFLDGVESRVGIQFNRNLLQQFLSIYIGSSKIFDGSLGLHLRPKLKDSVVRIYIHLETDTDPEELVRTAIALDGGYYSDELTQVLLKDTVIIGFNLFFDGHSDVELYPCSPGRKNGVRKNWGQYFTLYIRKNFSKKVNSLFDVSDLVYASFSKGNSEPILHFHFVDIKEIPKYFIFNGLGDRIYSFCQSQDCITYAVVGATEKNLESSRLENFNFSYNQHDGCQPLAIEQIL